MILLLLAAQAADPAEARYTSCVEAIPADTAVAAATEWRADGGGVLAHQCLGLAHTARAEYPAAAAAFEAAARDSERVRDGRAARLWVQAGNARLAAAEPAPALAAFDAALVHGGAAGELLGEIHLDRARALVALDRPADARAALDEAVRLAPRDPAAWLLSATLARRQDDLARARADIAEALTRAPDDSGVAAEAGAIAILSGNEADARQHWRNAVRLQPTSPAAQRAREMLARLDPGLVPAEPTTR